MAEYIDREKIFPNGVFYVNAENPETSLNELINRICNLPIADVVPKSEVEKIFDEVDSMLDLVGAMVGLDIRVYGKYAELKKKYTEDME